MKGAQTELPLPDPDADPATRAFGVWRHTPEGREISNLFIRLALQMKRRGWDHYSAQGVIENLRWHHHLKHGPDAEGFKINHNWRRALSVWAMQRVPDLAGFFRIRGKSEDEGESN